MQLIKEFNDTETFIYVDSPYLKTLLNGSYYQHEMSDEEHVELLETLNTSNSKIILSGYESVLYNSYLKDGEKIIIPTETFTGKT